MIKNIPIRKINVPAKELGVAQNFSIRKVQDMLNGKDMVQELHRHDFFYVLVLKNGSGKHEIDFTTYDIGNASVFFMRPGQVHQLQLKAESTGFLMEFTTDFYYPNDVVSHKLLRKVGAKNLCPIDFDGFEKLLSVLNHIDREFQEKKEGYQEVIKSNLSIFFIELVRQRCLNTTLSDKETTYTQERFEMFTELLETHITEHKQASYYAERMHLSLYQLNAITHTMQGKTTSELINEHIILEAKRYLLTTSNQVNQIAYYLGYEDVSYFIRFFKKHTGFSPDAFRQNLR